MGSIPNTVMNDVPSVPIGDFENTLSFPSEETSLGSGLPSHLPLGNVPCPSSPSHGFRGAYPDDKYFPTVGSVGYNDLRIISYLVEKLADSLKKG